MKEVQDDGRGRIDPADRKAYEQQYLHGAKLFEKALDEYTKSDNPFQREEFRVVMDKAMNVLNDTAKELKAQSLMEQNIKISKDYLAFTKYPENERAAEVLKEDLEKAKKSIY